MSRCGAEFEILLVLTLPKNREERRQRGKNDAQWVKTRQKKTHSCESEAICFGAKNSKSRGLRNIFSKSQEINETILAEISPQCEERAVEN